MVRSHAQLRGLSLWGLAAFLCAPAACNDAVELLRKETPAALARKEALAPGVETDWSHIPVPAADGPKLAPLASKVPIYPTPSRKEAAIGYLRVGARVSRSASPVGVSECPGGWYAVRPLGFVCAGAESTIDLDHPIVTAIRVEPNRALAMPYKYAFARAIAPNYLRIPTVAEQQQYEMGLDRHLASWRRLHEQWDRLAVGANDVPLDERGVGASPIPEEPRPMSIDERFGGDVENGIPTWLLGERKIPNLSSYQAPNFAVIASRVKRHAGVAVIGTFVAGADAGQRRFVITTDARLLPADKLKADSGSPFHGAYIKDAGLPVAWVYAQDASTWQVEGGQLVAGAKLRFREHVALTGKVRKFGDVRLVQTQAGAWLRSEDLKTAVKPRDLPSWARGTTRWIDISLLQQTLVLWEGATPVYATLISSGRDGLGEPGKTLSTPQGTFHIYQKHVTTTMDSNVADHEFELRDVPWVMYFKGGYALHGAYWHDDFGRARSHGCVNLAPIDARFVFGWSSPDVPEHWQAAYGGETFGTGTLIRIGP